MADALTSFLGLVKPNFNDPAGADQWGNKLNANFDKLDSRIAARRNIAINNTDHFATADEIAGAYLVLTGNAAGPVTLAFPAGTSGVFCVLNGTAGSGIVNVGIVGSTVVTAPRGRRSLIVCDGTDTFYADEVAGIPPGSFFPTFAQSPPDGYLFMFGQVLNQSQYPGLYNAYGSMFNTGGESGTQFRMPDMRGLTVAGYDSMGGNPRGELAGFGLGQKIGEAYHQLSVSELPSHGHNYFDPGHTHSINDPGHKHSENVVSTVAPNAASGGTQNVGNPSNTDTTVSSTGVSLNSSGVNITIGSTGSNAAHSSIQPSMVVNYIAKT